MAFNIYYVFHSPTCFGWHSGHLQGDFITRIQTYKFGELYHHHLVTIKIIISVKIS